MLPWPEAADSRLLWMTFLLLLFPALWVGTSEFYFQIGFDFRPLEIRDAEEDAVAYASRRGDHVIAKCALFFRADT